jgi:hypothetical protein
LSQQVIQICLRAICDVCVPTTGLFCGVDNSNHDGL